MNNRSILMLGGYGTTGKLIARGLLDKTDVPLIIAGRNPERAKEFADELNAEFTGARVTAEKADASKGGELRELFREARIVLVASSTSMFTDVIARAALDAQIDYFDIQYSSSKISYLKSLAAEIKRRELCFITDGGFHPGLPGVLVRWAAGEFDSMEKAIVSSLIKLDWKKFHIGTATVRELLVAMNDYDSSAFVDGKWQKASFFSTKGYMREDFGEPFGKRSCAPMFLEEMRAVQKSYPSVRNTGFYVGGFNWFVDYMVLPPAFLAMKLSPGLGQRVFSRLMLFGVKRFSRPPYSTILKLDAVGMKDGRRRELIATVSHRDGYILTAFCVVASLMQYLDGNIRKPGLQMQATIADPARMLNDLAAMGAERKLEWKG